MNFTDPATSLLAASGGDTVKLFDISVESPRDPCSLSYTPSPGSQVNSVKWNHTNLVVASAGDDKKISLWRSNGQSMGTIPAAGSDIGDNIEESFLTINFSTKASRYICSGGSGQVVRIWDLQKKRCVKWLRGHTDTITGVMYNCKDEHVASISVNGDLIIHNLSSGARATELKDPNAQVLRVLDYSRMSRHLLATAGDDGSVHLWDTTGRSPKLSWLKQHSAPTAGISFSPSNDKVIASVGMDKKLYTFDSGSRRHTFCITYEAPFSSVAFRDDGHTLAAGTSSGQVVFYDVRGKPQAITVLRAYGNSQAITSLCWQRSKPIFVNAKNCSNDTALLGGAVDDSILMPDPLPSLTTSSHSVSKMAAGTRNSVYSGPSPETVSLSATSGGSISGLQNPSGEEETPLRSTSWAGRSLARLHAPRSYNFKDDMEVFSPLVEVQPITPSLDKLWDQREGTKKDLDKKSSLLFPSSRRFPFPLEGGPDSQPTFDWRPSSTSKQQDDSHFPFSPLGSTPSASSTIEDSSAITPPEAWGGEKLSDKFTRLRQPVSTVSRFATFTSANLSSESMFSGLQDFSSSSGQPTMSLANLRDRDGFNDQENPLYSEGLRSSTSLSLGAKSILGQTSVEPLVSISTLPRRRSSYAERTSTIPLFTDGTSPAVGSPKIKKSGAETREELLNSLQSKSEVLGPMESFILPSINGVDAPPQKSHLDQNQQQGTSFSLQLFQGILEETLASFQKSIHEDIRNLHIEVLRQFHVQEMQLSNAISSVLEIQDKLMKEVQSLRKENQQLRQLL